YTNTLVLQRVPRVDDNIASQRDEHERDRDLRDARRRPFRKFEQAPDAEGQRHGPERRPDDEVDAGNLPRHRHREVDDQIVHRPQERHDQNVALAPALLRRFQEGLLLVCHAVAARADFRERVGYGRFLLLLVVLVVRRAAGEPAVLARCVQSVQHQQHARSRADALVGPPLGRRGDSSYTQREAGRDARDQDHCCYVLCSHFGLRRRASCLGQEGREPDAIVGPTNKLEDDGGADVDGVAGREVLAHGFFYGGAAMLCACRRLAAWQLGNQISTLVCRRTLGPNNS
ncbi:unnamed protein product, partial [Pelagomonas calceolata]